MILSPSCLGFLDSRNYCMSRTVIGNGMQKHHLNIPLNSLSRRRLHVLFPLSQDVLILVTSTACIRDDHTCTHTLVVLADRLIAGMRWQSADCRLPCVGNPSELLRTSADITVHGPFFLCHIAHVMGRAPCSNTVVLISNISFISKLCIPRIASRPKHRRMVDDS